MGIAKQLPQFVSAPLSFPLPADADDAVKFFLSKSRAELTFRAWRVNWTRVLHYAEQLSICPLPMTAGGAATVLSHMALDGYAYSTIAGTRNVMTVAHRLAGLPDPTLDDQIFDPTYRGIIRVVGAYNPNAKAALSVDQLRAMMRLALGRPPLEAIFVRTLLSSGFYGAFRRSELAAFDVRDCRIKPEGILFFVRRSKTDQYGRGAEVFVGALPNEPDLCPRAAMIAWRDLLGETSGPLFRRVAFNSICDASLDHKIVTRIVKRYAKRIGLEEGKYGAHSLRAGFITAALDKQVPEPTIARHSRHDDLNSIARYYRPNEYMNFTEKVS
jgi:integrase